MRALILILALSLVGCASTGPSSTTETLFIYGTMKAIEKAPDPQAKAERIRGIAQSILDVAEGESVKAEIVRRLIDEATQSADLSPADMYLVGQVTPLSLVFADDDGLISGEGLESLRVLLADVIAATELY